MRTNHNHPFPMPTTPQHPRIICIGGGTGLYTLLTGLKEHQPNAELAAIVSMMDSGGSTGRLRDEFGYLPPGDIRQCLVALSEAPRTMRQLMQHRFHPNNNHDNTTSTGLTGHVVGNILLTALKDLNNGNEYAAIEAMERLLRIRGKVYPITIDNCHLIAHLENGQTIKGEKNIDMPTHNPTLRITKLTLDPNATLFNPTRHAIEHADHIIIGPGDLYTSIMPNLIVEGLVDALKHAKQHGATIIFITNTMTKHGETNNFTANDFVHTIQEHLNSVTIDAIIVNNGIITEDQARAYAKEHATPVICDTQATTNEQLIITDNLVAEGEFARHDPHKLAKAINKAITALNNKKTKLRIRTDDRMSTLPDEVTKNKIN